MAPNTALAFLLVGIALWVLSVRDPPRQGRAVAFGLGLLAAALGASTVFEYLSGWNLEIDQFIFKDSLGAVKTAAPGRMAEATAAAFVLLGLAAALIAARRAHAVSEVLGLLGGGLALVALAGYLHNVRALYATGPFTGISFHTVLFLLVAACGLLAADPGHGAVALLTRETAGGTMARRILPFALVTPIFLGWLENLGESAGLYPNEIGDALVMLGSIVLIGIVVCWQGIALDRVDRDRLDATGAASHALETLRKLSRAVEQSPASVVITDTKGDIEYVNPKFTQVTGFSSDEVLGMNPRILKSGELSPEVYRELWETITAGREWSGEFHNRRKDGEPFWDLSSISPIFDEKRHITGFVSVNEDITERKRAEEALKFQNLLLATLSEVAPDGILVVDRTRKIVHFNSRFLAMWGISQKVAGAGDDAPVLGHVVDRVAAPDEFLARVKHLYEHPEETSREEVALKDGRTIERYSASMAGADGSQYGRVWYFRDVTERKRADETLAGRERYFRSLIENVQDIITIIDAEGTIRFQSPAAERVLGRSPGDFVGRNIQDFLHPDDASRVVATIRRGFESPELPQTSTFRFRHLDGSWRTMEGIGKILPGEGGPQIVVNSRDVTESHVLEEQLRQSQKMEAVGRLAGGIAHDFNNLLTVISGYTELAAGRLSPDDPSRTELAEVENAARRAADLTRQLLAFSRKQVLELRVINLNRVVSDTEKMLRRVIGEDIEFRTSLAEPLDSVKADVGQIVQVLLNLAVNSRDAMPKGGKLTIETSEIVLAESHAAFPFDVPPGPYVVLAVDDTGAGMDKQTLSRVFEPFFTTKETGKGTGLGLSTVYGVVVQSGGHVTVESTPGAGTTFRIYLPRVKAVPERSRSSASHARVADGTETVLVVEDEDGVRKLICRSLQARGYNPLPAGGGSEALLIAETHAGGIDLMLTDVVMPQLSGPDLARRVGALRPRMKVLFMSGYIDDEIVRNGVRDAGTAFLQKPFTIGALAKKMRAVLDEGAE